MRIRALVIRFNPEEASIKHISQWVIVVSLCATAHGWAAASPATNTSMRQACKLEIASNDMMLYDKKELGAPGDCVQVQLTLKHSGTLPAQVMGHNWVLVKASDLNAVASAGAAAGLRNNYVPPDDARVIAHTAIIGGGETTSIHFSTASLAKGEQYLYFCSVPGHGAVMRGTFRFG